MTRYWICSTDLEHVQRCVEGGYTEADAGHETRLRRLTRGDGIAFYSGRTARRTGRALQRFTALGVVADDEPHRAATGAEDAPGPWRRRVDFEDVEAAPLKPLLPMLAVQGASVDGEERWGVPFRRGLLEVAPGDFACVAGALRDAALLREPPAPGLLR